MADPDHQPAPIDQNPLSRSSDKYKVYFEHSPVALWEIDYSNVLAALEQIKLHRQTLKSYLESHPSEVIKIISKLAVSDINQFALKTLGYTDKQQIIQTPGKIFDLSSSLALIDELLAIANHETSFETTVENKRADGKVRSFRLRWEILPGSEAKMDCALVSTIDITDQVQTDKIQSAVYQMANAASNTENLNDLYQSLHRILGGLMPAKNFYIALYHEAEGMISFPYFVDELDPIPAPRKFGNGWTEYVIRTKEPMLLSQENVRRLEQEEGVKTFGYDSLDWLGVPLKVEDRLIGIVAVQSYSEGVRYTEVEKNILTFVSNQIAMVIDRKRTEEELKYSSLHDPLTGLYNRGYFEEEVKRLNSGRQSPVGVIMVDMDNLKVTNDSYGHDAGDALIKSFARELMNSFRSNDVVARLGGDEFGVLLPISPLIVVEKAVERLQVKVDESNKSNPKFPIKYSLGYHTNEDGCSLGDALKIADQRMYIHKSLNKLSPEE
jgi:diguanylate cyclase (GGDEF)-like protein